MSPAAVSYLNAVYKGHVNELALYITIQWHSIKIQSTRLSGVMGRRKVTINPKPQIKQKQSNMVKNGLNVNLFS
jgi:hypothetical protein